jgi:phage shock protein PspC (stress-responsive transcriptional regulator)
VSQHEDRPAGTAAAGTPPHDPPQPPSDMSDGPAGAGGSGDRSGPRVLRRDPATGLVAGVAAGIARSYGIDVTWVRIGLAVATIFGNGLGIVAYLIAWISMPAATDAEVAAAGWSAARAERSGARLADRLDAAWQGRGAAFWLGALLVALGGLALTGTLASGLGFRLPSASFGDLTVPLVLVLVGVLIWRSSRSSGPVVAAGLGERIGARFATFEQEVEAFGVKAEAFERGFESREAARRATEGPRQLGPLTFGLAMVAFGVLWLLSNLDALDITLTQALAAALLVTGVGLLVGAFAGRARGIVWLGLLITPFLLASIALARLPVPLSDLRVIEVGDEITMVRPVDADEVGEPLVFGVGQVVVDLRGLDAAALTDRARTEVDVELGIGDLVLLLPTDVRIELDVELGIGRLNLDGTRSSGLGIERTLWLPITTGSDLGPLLVIDVAQGIGRMEVSR